MDFVQIVQLVITLIAGITGVRVIQLFKNLFGLEDNGARILALIVSFLLAGVGVFVGGEFSNVEITMEAIAAIAGAVYTLANLIYGFLSGGTSAAAKALGIAGLQIEG